jgi:hypothetical protein
MLPNWVTSTLDRRPGVIVLVAMDGLCADAVDREALEADAHQHRMVRRRRQRQPAGNLDRPQAMAPAPRDDPAYHH